MITNKQKFIFSILSIGSALLGIIAIVPFKILCNRLGIDSVNIDVFELITKLLILPIIIALVCIYGNKVRVDNYNEQTKVSIAAIKMTYAPAVIYLTGLLAWAVGVVYMSGALRASVKATLAVVVFLGGALVYNILFGLFTHWLYKLSNNAIRLVNGIFALISILAVLAVFVTYQGAPIIKTLPGKWAMFEMFVCTCAFGFTLLTICKAVFGNEGVKVVLDRGETFTDEEVELIISSEVQEDINVKFEEYYQKGKGSFVEEKVELEEIQPEEEIQVEEVEEIQPEEQKETQVEEKPEEVQ